MTTTYRDLVHELRKRSRSALVQVRLRELLEREPPDEAIAGELRQALEGARIPQPSELERRWHPGIGESYVLLVGTCRPHVGRLRVTRSPSTALARVEAEHLDGTARGQVNLAYHVLSRYLVETARGTPSDGARLTVWTTEGGHTKGASLGVAAAAALVSSWTGVAPARDVAATAAVRPDGTLAPIEGLAEKLSALRVAYPDVRTVVVAAAQKDVVCPAAIVLERRDTLREALEVLGLDLTQVHGPPLPLGVARQEIEGFRFAHASAYSLDAWRHLALRAETLAAHPDLAPDIRVKALAFAALFHLHGAEVRRAASVLDGLPPEAVAELGNHDQTWCEIIHATAAIDRDDLAAARRWGEAAVRRARALVAGEQRDVLGRALGTLGRVHLHTGEPAKARALLEESVAHHRKWEPATLPRSLTYLATACRRGDDLECARVTIDEALRIAAQKPGEAEASSSILFARYERGRILYELGELDEAEPDLLFVYTSQTSPHDYPRLGALRYLAAISIRRGEPLGLERLNEALRVAAETRGRGALHEVAVAASGEALGWSELLPEDVREKAEQTWSAVHAGIDRAVALAKVVY